MATQIGENSNTVKLPGIPAKDVAPASPRFLPLALNSGQRWLLLPLALLVAGAAALAVDCGLSRWFVDGHCPGELRRLLNAIEPFGNGWGVAVILLVVFNLDLPRRATLPRLLAMSLGAGLMADVIKLTVARVRPHNFSFDGTTFDTFGQFFPFLGTGSVDQSFPSAHTATAVGLAIALGWLYPRGRGLFIALAVLVACQRLQSGAHYLSDVLCGAGVGCAVALACLNNARLAGWFGRLEVRLQALWQVAELTVVSEEGDNPPLETPAEDDRSKAA